MLLLRFRRPGSTGEDQAIYSPVRRADKAGASFSRRSTEIKNSPSPKAWAAARKFEMKAFGLEVIGSREAITAH
jgi:hypothetical protein